MARTHATYLAILVPSLVLGFLPVLLTSDVTPLSAAVHRQLAQRHAELESAGIGVAALVSVLVLLGHLSDVASWKGRSAAQAAYKTALAVLAAVGLLLLTPLFPPAPLFCGLLLNVVVVYLAKHALGLADSKGQLQAYLSAVSLAFSVVGALLLILWLAWLACWSPKWPSPLARSEQALVEASAGAAWLEVCCPADAVGKRHSLCNGPYTVFFHMEAEGETCNESLRRHEGGNATCWENVESYDEEGRLWFAQTYEEAELYAREEPHAYLWMFKALEPNYLFHVSPETLRNYFTYVLRDGDSLEFPLWWWNATLFGRDQHSMINCTKKNIFRIAFGVQCGLNIPEILTRCDEEPNLTAECENNWELTRFSRTDVDNAFIRVLCGAQFDGFVADDIRMTQDMDALVDHRDKFGEAYRVMQHQDAEGCLCSSDNLERNTLMYLDKGPNRTDSNLSRYVPHESGAAIPHQQSQASPAQCTDPPLSWSPVLEDDGLVGALVHFASPAILAFIYLVGALCTWRHKAIAADIASSDGDSEGLRVRRSLMFCLALLLTSILLAYMGLAMSPYSELVDKLALYGGAAGAVAAFACLGLAIGEKHLLDLAVQDSTVKQWVTFLQSDMAKGVVALLLLPVSPLIFAVDALHQAARRRFWSWGFLEEDPGKEGVLTKELRGVVAWEKATVLPVAMYAGIAIVGLRTVAFFIPPIIAWFNLVLAPTSFAVVLLVSAVVAVLAFLLPPVSGQMIYLPMSMIIVKKWGCDGGGQLAIAILAAMLSCLAVKLCAAALQQKAIGAPFASSVAVKKTLGFHTASYRVARSILCQRGVTLRKAVVLTGMPDWPISVLCGLLDLPLLSTLACTAPEVFKILPSCMASGFLVKSREEGAPAVYGSLFEVCFTLDMLIPCCLAMFVGVLVKAEMEKHEAEIGNPDSDWHRDPQEKEILEAIENGRAEAEVLADVTAWRVQPCWVRLGLVAGSLLSSCSAYLAGARPFHRFDFEDPAGLDKLPGGSMAGLIRPEGCFTDVAKCNFLSTTFRLLDAGAGGCHVRLCGGL